MSFGSIISSAIHFAFQIHDTLSRAFTAEWNANSVLDLKELIVAQGGLLWLVEPTLQSRQLLAKFLTFHFINLTRFR